MKKKEKETDTRSDKSKSAAIAQRGIRTSRDFADMMTALIAEILSGQVAPNTANAVCNAGGKLLKVIEMEIRYGAPVPQGQGQRSLPLATMARAGQLPQ